MKKVALPLRVHPIIKHQLEQEAKINDIGLSTHTENILKKHISKQEIKLGKKEYGK